jgi:hypothetical protein
MVAQYQEKWEEDKKGMETILPPKLFTTGFREKW